MTESTTSKYFNKAGLGPREFMVLIVLVVLLSCFFIAFIIDASKYGASRGSCIYNLKELGFVMLMYSDEQQNASLPPQRVHDANGDIIAWSKTPDMTKLFPEYMRKLSVMTCPSYTQDKGLSEWDAGLSQNPDYTKSALNGNGKVDLEELIEGSYMYYGFSFRQSDRNVEVLESSIESLREDFEQLLGELKSGKTEVLNENWVVRDSNAVYVKTKLEMTSTTTRRLWPEGLRPVYRLYRGAEENWRFDSSSPGVVFNQPVNVIIAHDRIRQDGTTSHLREGENNYGVNILYLDGRVEFLSYSEDNLFPFGAVGGIFQRRW